MSSALHTVHVRVNDAATGQPTPVRIRFTGPNGEYYAPLGRLTEFLMDCGEDVGGNLSLHGKAYAYIDGSCEIRLPAGPLRVDIHKGPEYAPIQQDLNLATGKLALRFAIERWTNLQPEGWYSGDSGAFCLSPHAALLEGAAENLAVVNLLAREFLVPIEEQGREVVAIPNILAFSGQSPALERPGHLVVVNTYNKHPLLGSLTLLNCHRVVYPLRFGDAAGPEDWALRDWCAQCHRKGGLVVWSDFERYPLAKHGTKVDVGGEEREALESEGLAAAILGLVDAVEITDLFWRDWIDELYLLWNGGLLLPLAGGGAKQDNRHCLGSPRTYARLHRNEAFTYQSWIEAVRAGRTFVSNGPLLSFSVNGLDPGGTVDVPAAAASVHVRAEARSWPFFKQLELVINGKVVASAASSGSPATALIEQDVPLTGSAWIAACCYAVHDSDQADLPGYTGAHSSPVHVRLDGQPLRPQATAIAHLRGRLDAGVNWLASRGRFADDQQRAKRTESFAEAQAELQKRLPSP